MANTKITNHIVDSTVITGQTAVTAADGDYLLVADASDSNALKKVLASDLIQTSEEISDIVGAMVSSNTESGITVAYEDSDNTLDFTLAAAQPNITSLGTLTTLTVDDISIDGSTISDAGVFGIDAGSHIILDADGGNIYLTDGGTDVGVFQLSNSSLVMRSLVSDEDIIFKGNDGGSAITALTLDMSDAGTAIFNNNIKVADAGVFIGAGDDLRLQHDGTDSFVTNYTGDLKFTQSVDDKDITFDCDDGSGGTERYITIDGSTKYIQFDQHTKVTDSNRIDFGNASDLQIYHDGTNSYLNNATGDLYIRTVNNLRITDTSNNKMILCQDGGETQLYYNGAEKLNTTANGVDVTGKVVCTTSARIGQVALTSSSNAVAWDSAAAANAYHVTTENTTFSAPSNAAEGAIISVEIAQGGTARTIAWNTVFEFAASTAPTITATANKTDILAFRYNGSVWQEIGRVQNMAQT